METTREEIERRMNCPTHGLQIRAANGRCINCKRDYDRERSARLWSAGEHWDQRPENSLRRYWSKSDHGLRRHSADTVESMEVAIAFARSLGMDDFVDQFLADWAAEKDVVFQFRWRTQKHG